MRPVHGEVAGLDSSLGDDARYRRSDVEVLHLHLETVHLLESLAHLRLSHRQIFCARADFHELEPLLRGAHAGGVFGEARSALRHVRPRAIRLGRHLAPLLRADDARLVQSAQRARVRLCFLLPGKGGGDFRLAALARRLRLGDGGRCSGDFLGSASGFQFRKVRPRGGEFAPGQLQVDSFDGGIKARKNLPLHDARPLPHQDFLRLTLGAGHELHLASGQKGTRGRHAPAQAAHDYFLHLNRDDAVSPPPGTTRFDDGELARNHYEREAEGCGCCSAHLSRAPPKENAESDYIARCILCGGARNFIIKSWKSTFGRKRVPEQSVVWEG